MTVGSFAVRAVAHDGRPLLNCAVIASGPAAALSVIKRSMGEIPAGTRFHVRGGAPRRPEDYGGRDLDRLPFWFDEASHLSLEAWEAVSQWGTVERFDEDPDRALEEFRGEEYLAYAIAFLILAIAAMQALRWWLS